MDSLSETTRVQLFLHRLIQDTAEERTRSWLAQQEEKLRTGFSERVFYLSFGMVPRFVSKQSLVLDKARPVSDSPSEPDHRLDLEDLRQAVRTYLLLLLPENEVTTRLSILGRLLETADIDEQVTVYRSLPLFSHPKSLTSLVTNGLRTNITLVFDAIALRNPYPARFLDEAAWNQLVLKAVFMERPLYLIVDADKRANSTLARILVDVAHERWAAGRTVTPELWRFVAPYLDASHQPDLERVIASENPWEQAAGVLACEQSHQPALQSLAEYARGQPAISTDKLNWQRIGEACATDR